MIITKELLLREADSRNITNYSQKSVFNENTILKSKNKKYDVFISHSYSDKKLIFTLVKLFNSCGYSVYVDWIVDSELDRTSVSAETAEIVRNRIMESNSLAYISTSNIADSKWCPWELGLADGLHNGRASILPIINEGATFNGQEYLGTYPYIDYQMDKQGFNQFWINDQENSNKYTNLRNWLNGKPLYEHMQK